MKTMINENWVEEEKPLRRSLVFTYGVGHMLNDITQSCWYTYLLLYLTDIGLPPSSAAIVTLTGQFADAFTTIIVGQLIDRYGHFKRWHGIGCIMVAFSFISLFSGLCIPCKIGGSYSQMTQTVWYCISAVIYCSGWSCTQISHMSMVNCITLNESSRIACVSCRNAFTMIASLIYYAITLFIFTDTIYGLQDIKVQYRWMSYISIFIGSVFVIIFHLGIKEPSNKNGGCAKTRVNTPWTYWLKKVSYYQVSSVYVLTRVVTNVSQSFLAVYVINDLRMSQSSKSLVPALIYLCSFITSVLLQELEWSNKKLKNLFSSGGILWFLCGAAVMWLPINLNLFMYALSVLIGIANSLMMVTSTGMESALVDKHLDGSTFVYGSMGFIDKVLCGIALYFLESFENVDPVPCNPKHACLSVTRFSLGFIPGIAALLGVIVSFMMDLQTSHSYHLEEPLLE